MAFKYLPAALVRLNYFMESICFLGIFQMILMSLTISSGVVLFEPITQGAQK